MVTSSNNSTMSIKLLYINNWRKSTYFMKKILQLPVAFLFLILPFIAVAQQPTPQPYSGSQVNYNRTWDALAPGLAPTALSTAASTDATQTTQYYDGFGRPLQTVVKKGSPLGNDMVQAHSYDPTTANELYQYLPFSSNAATSGDLTNDGTFKTDAFQEQAAFYNTIYGPSGLNTGDASWPYSQIDYDMSPLNRVVDTYAPGANWVGSQSANLPTPHDQQQKVFLNTSNDNVQIWNINAAQGSIPQDGGAYGANQLFKTAKTDEQGQQTITFTDSYGQVVLKKVRYTATLEQGQGAASTSTAHTGWLCTYYVYDDFGNLRFIIPPDLVAQIDGSWSISQSQADELCYRFEYDALNRMIIKKAPGTPSGSGGEVWMVYDVRDRLVMTQDGNLRNSQSAQSQPGQAQWLCHIYDGLDREVATGLITSSNSLSTMQQAVTSQTGNNTSGTITITAPTPTQGENPVLNQPSTTGNYVGIQSVTLNFNFSSSGPFTASIGLPPATSTSTVVVNNNPIPSGLTLTQLTATFYDNYNWLAASGVDQSKLLNTTYTSNGTYFNTNYGAAPYPVQISQSTQLQGQVTGKIVSTLTSPSQNLYSYNIYDNRGRIIQNSNINVSGGTDVVTNQYDFSGKVIRTLVSHVKAGSNPQNHLILTEMTYDPMGRLQQIQKSVTSTVQGITLSTPLTTVATDSYSELGQLSKKAFENNLETMQYDYNIRGWSLGMNRNYAKTASSTSNYFGYDLGYDQGAITVAGGTQIGSYVPRYNSSIAGTVWKTRGDNQQRKYDYSYDNYTSRLSVADFNQQSGSQFDKSGGIDFSVNIPAYDASGNIEQMNQKGWILGGSQQIDQLKYHYIGAPNYGNSNKLLYVEDLSTYNSNTSSKLGDFHYAGNKTTSSVDYSFDDNGNATADANRALAQVVYNYLNLPQTMTIANSKGSIQYIYDADGNKLQKITKETAGNVTFNGSSYTTSITTTTSYMAGCVYKSLVYGNPALSSQQYTDQLQFVSDEEGRIRPLYTNASSPTSLTGFAFDYFLRDNVNNVRMVLTDETWEDYYPAVTVETNDIANELQYYSITNDAAHVVDMGTLTWYTNLNIPSYTNSNPNTPNPGNPTPNANSVNMYKLNGSTGDRFGLGITLKVMSGDQVSIQGRSIWNSTGASAGSYPVANVVTNLLSAFAGSPTVAANSEQITGSALGGSASLVSTLQGLLNQTPSPPQPTTEPKAAINWILFNDQFQPIIVGSSPVDQQGNQMYIHPLQNVAITTNGYLYVYCSNESDIDVYFDNFQVTHTRGPILDETHYYPAGLVMAGISDQAWNKLLNNYQYQSKELQAGEFSDGTGLALHDFGARFYDQQLGRWHTQDPSSQYANPYLAMGNSWQNGIDRNGKNFGQDVANFFETGDAFETATMIFATLGVGYLTGALSSGQWDVGKWSDNTILTAMIATISYETAMAGGMALGAGGFVGNVTSTTMGVHSIIAGAGEAIMQNLISAELSDLMTTGAGMSWKEAEAAVVSGAISGAFQAPGMQNGLDNLMSSGTFNIAVSPSFTSYFQGVASNTIGGSLATWAKDEILNVPSQYIGNDIAGSAVGNAIGQIAHQTAQAVGFGSASISNGNDVRFSSRLFNNLVSNAASALMQQVFTDLFTQGENSYDNNLNHQAGDNFIPAWGEGTLNDMLFPQNDWPPSPGESYPY
jgi:RHS repeat-associated protein